jgi:HSP20 family protein
MALMRLDPFRELDRFTEQVMTRRRVPPTMPVEVYRSGDHFIVYIDLHGVDPEDVDLTVEHRLAHPVLMTTQLPTARSGVSGGRSDRS